MTSTRTAQLRPELSILLTEAGTGRTALVLHGGGGPITVQSLSEHLARTFHVLSPTHPGWNGTLRPESLTRIGDLADAYLQLLEAEGLRDVLVVGSSIGGWLASEMALRDSKGLISGLVLINSVGVAIEGQPIRNLFTLTPRAIAEHAYHDADRFYVDPATVPPEQKARQQANMATLRVIAGDPYMHDPALLERLGQVRVPVLVLWGESDRIVTPDYGRALARAFPNARFELIPRAGHLPQLEQPQSTFAAIDGYVASLPSPRT
ncbi:alpha/beta fold hydrolase [Hyalangium versicolor]|uniref:alpha/beta fold hydrolase n=1 Tax=Hyalangium versicolor TaxID=2861190 RepID=UPI001CCB9648|nr:alpha/beta hydrolase [Hyalangium versicolor]